MNLVEFIVSTVNTLLETRLLLRIDIGICLLRLLKILNFGFKISKTLFERRDAIILTAIQCEKRNGRYDAKTKQPYVIGLQDDSLFAYAGLWETWKDKAMSETLEACGAIARSCRVCSDASLAHFRKRSLLDYLRTMLAADPS